MKKVETGRTATTMSNVLPAFQRHPYKIQNLILFLGQSAYEMRLSPKFIVIFKFGGFKGIVRSLCPWCTRDRTARCTEREQKGCTHQQNPDQKSNSFNKTPADY